jgi:hypothetical protein
MHDRPNLDLAAMVQNWAALGQFSCLAHIVSLDEREPADHVFGFGKRTIDYALGARLDQLAGSLKGLAPFHHMTAFGKALEPGLPLLKDLLLKFRRGRPVPSSVQIYEFCHASYSLVATIDD